MPSSTAYDLSYGIGFKGFSDTYQVAVQLENYKNQFPLDHVLTSDHSDIQTIDQPFTLEVDISRYYLEGNTENNVVLGRSIVEFGALGIEWQGYNQTSKLHFQPVSELLFFEDVDNSLWIVMLIMLFVMLAWLLQRCVYGINWVSYHYHDIGLLTNEDVDDDDDERGPRLFFPRVWSSRFGFQGGLTTHELNFLVVMCMILASLLLVLDQTGLARSKLCMFSFTCDDPNGYPLSKARQVMINSVFYYGFGVLIYCIVALSISTVYNRHHAMNNDKAKSEGFRKQPMKLMDLYLPIFDVLVQSLWLISIPLKPGIYENMSWLFMGIFWMWVSVWGLAEVWLFNCSKKRGIYWVINMIVSILAFSYTVVAVTLLTVTPVAGLIVPGNVSLEVYFWITFAMVGLGPIPPGIAALWILLTALVKHKGVAIQEYFDDMQELEDAANDDNSDDDAIPLKKTSTAVKKRFVKSSTEGYNNNGYNHNTNYVMYSANMIV
jgi:hypothetical protein